MFDDHNKNKIVYIVDDDASLRASLRLAFEMAQYQVVDFASAIGFLTLKDFKSPAVLILDVRMGGMTGVELQERLVQRDVDLPIVFISGSSTVHETVKAMKSGAADFLLKPFKTAEVLKMTAKAFDDLLSRLAAAEQERLRNEKLAILTPREREVCFLVCEGHTNKDIGVKLGVRADTAKQYKQKIFEKLAVAGVPELIEFMTYVR